MWQVFYAIVRLLLGIEDNNRHKHDATAAIMMGYSYIVSSMHARTLILTNTGGM
jgi:hypothetical protein